MTDIIGPALAAYYETHPVRYDDHVWASKLLSCPRAHAHERRQDPPVHPELLLIPPGLQRLFDLGHAAQEYWFQVLSLTYHCQREVPVRARGVTGRIDILLRLEEDGLVKTSSSGREYQDVPVEIKFSQTSDPAHLWQLASYMYAGEYPTGILIRDRGREQEVVHLSTDAMTQTRLPALSYRAHNPDGSLYKYNGKTFEIPPQHLQTVIDQQRRAYLRPEEGQLAAPTIGRCLRQEEDTLVPHCPYWCWGGAEKTFTPVWDEGECFIQTPQGRLPVIGDWRRKPERMGEF